MFRAASMLFRAASTLFGAAVMLFRADLVDVLGLGAMKLVSRLHDFQVVEISPSVSTLRGRPRCSKIILNEYLAAASASYNSATHANAIAFFLIGNQRKRLGSWQRQALENKSGRRGSNPRRPAWEAGIRKRACKFLTLLR